MDFLPDATKLYSYLIGLDSVGIKAIFSTIVAIIGYCKAKKYVEAFKQKPSELISEFYFLEDMINNSNVIPKSLKEDLYIILCKIAKPEIGPISLETKNVVQYIFDKKKDIKLIRAFLYTDKLVFNGKKITYKKNYKFKERTFEIFYFLFAILSLTPSILVQFKPFNEIKIGQFITISFIFLFCFGSLAYLSLMRYSKFFWAKKLLDGIV